MKIYISKQKRWASGKEAAKLPVVFNLALTTATRFRGFSQTVEEGIQMSKQGSFTDIPGLVGKK
ncbi:methylamine utilization protein MauG [Novimethylophilus kurashikiensis]|uniref:Methylamine utilization protein MauG n=1 Tax=Novimethylophilus kurashikiensis TaxID=1825523 RepID=A0A2R5F963_9PROT|nr:hypothetical protein [Novimethylophilus kurashikiensis]GBG14575.1 methylamine utilization protein MauG [Novimethylophilus kurashikiensis]